MARLTVEDCLNHIHNRFELVLKASERARMLERGASPLVEWDNDKPAVVALREIAEGFYDKEEVVEEEAIEEIVEEKILKQPAEKSPEEKV